MNNSFETKDNFDTTNLGGHQVVAKQVVDKLEINGLPAKHVIAEGLVLNLEAGANRELPDSLTQDRVAEAMEAVIFIRLRQLRHKTVGDMEELHYKTLRYPAVLWPIVRSIGDIIDPDDATEIKVTFGSGLARFADKKYDWKLIVETLRQLSAVGIKLGLEMATALPKAKDGNIVALSFMVDNGRLVSHSAEKGHSDAIVAAAIDYQFGKYVWGLPRWEYNKVSWYHSQLYKVVESSFRRAS